MLNRIKNLLLIGTPLTLFVAIYTAFSIQKELGNFNRTFIEFPTRPDYVWSLSSSGFYPAGVHSDTIFLGRKEKPSELFLVTTRKPHLFDSLKINIDLPKDEVTEIDVYQTDLFLTELRSNRVFSGSFKTPRMHEITITPNFFASSVPLNRNSLAVKTLFKDRQENVLGLIRNGEQKITFAPDILQKQIDGIFCTDGMMLYNQEESKVVYLYYYRNQFMVMDTSLSLLYRGNTIDSTTHADIKVVEVKSRKIVTLDSPPRITNASSSTSGRWLFVNSTIMARNEMLQQFKESAVIDVYRIDNGAYAFSFYLSDYRGIKMKSFRVLGDKILIMFRNYLVCYDLPDAFSQSN